MSKNLDSDRRRAAAEYVDLNQGYGEQAEKRSANPDRQDVDREAMKQIRAINLETRVLPAFLGLTEKVKEEGPQVVDIDGENVVVKQQGEDLYIGEESGENAVIFGFEGSRVVPKEIIGEEGKDLPAPQLHYALVACWQELEK